MRRIFFGLSVALLLTACGATRSATVADSLTREEALAQLDALQPQPGTNAADFTRLKTAIRRSLESSNVTRFTSATPGGAAGTVSDLALTGDASGIHLVWTYANRADYDQNRQVNIADLSVLGANLGKGSSSPDWLTKAKPADGDGNGLVTISDITPIGSSLLATVDGYWVQSSTTPSDAGSWADLGQVTFADATLESGNPFKRFSFTLDNPQVGTFFRVRPYSGEDLGPVSNYLQLADGPPSITDLQPQAGNAGAVVQFTPTLAGSPVDDYAWDFGGGAVPNTTIDPSPTVTLGAAGNYSARLTVTGAQGSDTYDFTLAVGAAGNPPHIDDVQPLSGWGNGGHVTMTATLSGGAPDTYAWDFTAAGGAMTPETSSDPAPDVTLGALGGYNVSLTVGNADGTDTFNFTFNVTTMQTPLAAPVNLRATDGDYNDYVHLTWSPDPGDDTPDDYVILRSDSEVGPFNTVTTTNSLYVDDFPPTRNVPYWYEVVARKTDRFDSSPSGSDSGYAFDGLPGSWHGTSIGAVTDEAATYLRMIDCNGRPAIARRGQNPFYRVEWIKCQDGNGTTWDSPVDIGSSSYGDFADLAVVNGKPALLMNKEFDFPPAAFYASAFDADATVWNQPTQCNSTSLSGTQRLAEVNGKPAFTFGSGPLNFVEATDALGQFWPVAPVNVFPHGNANNILILPDGNPAVTVSWVDSNIYYAFILRATVPDGTDWTGANAITKALGSDDFYADFLGFSGGLPWLGGQKFVSGTYSRGTLFADDALGDGWSSGNVQVGGTNGVVDSSFAVLNGRPALAYTTPNGPGNYQLWYTEAVDSHAGSWIAPVLVWSGASEASTTLTGIGTPQRPAVAFMYTLAGVWKLNFAEKY